uniref:Uncharacterized protein n=1 Tax=Prolemur simus TaxID=1328070 RepID=A0A8C8ZCG1_PROSS
MPVILALWKSEEGRSLEDDGGADYWETNPDCVNDMSEKEQRRGAKTMQGSGYQEHLDIYKLRKCFQEHQTLKEKEPETGPKTSYSYIGKFGIELYRMDKSAVGFEYQGKIEKHASQKDYLSGSDSKYGKIRALKSSISLQAAT